MNRRLLKLIQPSLLLLGAIVVCLFGAMILSGDGTLELDVSRFPLGTGYVVLCAGTLAVCMIGIDSIYRVIFSLKKRFSKNISELPSRFKLRFKNQSNDDSLLARIRECEKQ
jgi:TRAP-type C4-dicarboxylate transport system permease small subunit